MSVILTVSPDLFRLVCNASITALLSPVGAGVAVWVLDFWLVLLDLVSLALLLLQAVRVRLAMAKDRASSFFILVLD